MVTKLLTVPLIAASFVFGALLARHLSGSLSTLNYEALAALQSLDSALREPPKFVKLAASIQSVNVSRNEIVVIATDPYTNRLTLPLRISLSPTNPAISEHANFAYTGPAAEALHPGQNIFVQVTRVGSQLRAGGIQTK